MNHQPSPFAPAPTQLDALPKALRARGYRFIAVTPATHRIVNARPENGMARGIADVFGWNRNFTPEILGPELFAIAQSAGVVVPAGNARAGVWRSLVRAASLGELILLHSSFPTDSPESVFFGPDTYRFADTVVAHLARRPVIGRAIDIGCGTGAVGLAIARAYPGAQVVLADLSPAALAAASANAAAAGLANVCCCHGDLLDGVEGRFDLIVANPPYLIDPAARLYRHGGGRLGEGVSLRIVRTAPPRLAAGGSLVLYTGCAIVDGRDPFREAALPLVEAAGCRWTYREIDPDVFGEELAGGAYAGADRIAAVALTVERPS